MVNDAKQTMRIISIGNQLFYVLEPAKAILSSMIKGASAIQFDHSQSVCAPLITHAITHGQDHPVAFRNITGTPKNLQGIFDGLFDISALGLVMGGIHISIKGHAPSTGRTG